jgi:hypothetical protein
MTSVLHALVNCCVSCTLLLVVIGTLMRSRTLVCILLVCFCQLVHIILVVGIVYQGMVTGLFSHIWDHHVVV